MAKDHRQPAHTGLLCCGNKFKFKIVLDKEVAFEGECSLPEYLQEPQDPAQEAGTKSHLMDRVICPGPADGVCLLPPYSAPVSLRNSGAKIIFQLL
jgi:hypothetical protein